MGRTTGGEEKEEGEKEGGIEIVRKSGREEKWELRKDRLLKWKVGKKGGR